MANTKTPTQNNSIGIAEMRADGAIVLQLRATTMDEGVEGAVGDGMLIYTPDSDGYADLLDHLGGLAPNETKPVPPWPTPPKTE
ncbi:MAG: hypothetical protein ACPGO3_14985 [Magnetospiraceae bacterium]